MRSVFIAVALVSVQIVFSVGALAKQSNGQIAQPSYGRHHGHAMPAAQRPTGTSLPLWTGEFTDITGHKTKYRMVGKDPAAGGAVTQIDVYIIPIKMKYGPDNGNREFDPNKDKASNGLTTLQNMIASPVFDVSHDYVVGPTDLGRTQYADAFQRGNFWSSVNTNNGYHVYLNEPMTLMEQEIDVQPGEGEVGEHFGVMAGTMAQSEFQTAIEKILGKFPQIEPNALTIFVTDQIYLTDLAGNCCQAGFHDHLSDGHTYVYATYIKPKKKGEKKLPLGVDVLALSHEIGDWLDDPLGENKVTCNDNTLHRKRTMEVADPLAGSWKEGIGALEVPLNDFTYHMAPLVFITYFGAPTDTSVNGWFSFNNEKDAACPTGAAVLTFDPDKDAQATFPASINDAGYATGLYVDKLGLKRGFVRDDDGNFVAFDGAQGASSTAPLSINDSGDVAGYFTTGSVIHGFVRSAATGSIEPFDIDGATETYVSGINDVGTITGWYTKADQSTGGFKQSGKKLTIYNPFGSNFSQALQTTTSNVTLGSYLGAAGEFHGFVQVGNGNPLSFDAVGSVYMNPTAIDSARDIVGWFNDSTGKAHGFAWLSDGIISTVDFPGATATIATGVNDNEVVVGYYLTAGHKHGFFQIGHHAPTSFDYPDSIGTEIVGVNDAGEMVGDYADSNGVPHGFVRTP